MAPVPKDLSFVKIGLVGDSKVGKTSVMKAFKGEKIDSSYDPTLLVSFDRHIVEEKHKNVSVSSRINLLPLSILSGISAAIRPSMTSESIASEI